MFILLPSFLTTYLPSLTAGVDYIAVNMSLTFPDGAAVGNSLGRQCFLIHTTEDSTPEPDESLQLTLTSGSSIFLVVQTGRGTATVIIEDDDGMLSHTFSLLL